MRVLGKEIRTRRDVALPPDLRFQALDRQSLLPRDQGRARGWWWRRRCDGTNNGTLWLWGVLTGANVSEQGQQCHPSRGPRGQGGHGTITLLQQLT